MKLMTYYKAKIPEAWARVQWCKEVFGRPFQDLPPEQRQWNNMRWYRNKGYLYFRDAEDFMIYVLRWGNEHTDNTKNK
jgi:hypothetical protein